MLGVSGKYTICQLSNKLSMLSLSSSGVAHSGYLLFRMAFFDSTLHASQLRTSSLRYLQQYNDGAKCFSKELGKYK